MRAGGGALAGLLAAAAVLHVAGNGAALIARFGASSVLLHAVPNSALVQPSSAVAGTTLSAIVAVPVALVVPQGVWLAPVAVAPEAGLIEVAGLFRTHEFPWIPVVRAGGVLAGVILQIDLIPQGGGRGLARTGALRGWCGADGSGRRRRISCRGDAACHACDAGGRAVAVDGRRRGRGGAGGG
ncbi:HPP family protein [Tabrizicola sp.]|uniref:HPP family protein n=1 Tax=Tabrizicola sp. TaxID=2005166 RepID=UPI0035232584